MGIPREHGTRDAPGDAHDHLVARGGFGQFGDQSVAVTLRGRDLVIEVRDQGLGIPAIEQDRIF